MISKMILTIARNFHSFLLNNRVEISQILSNAMKLFKHKLLLKPIKYSMENESWRSKQPSNTVKSKAGHQSKPISKKISKYNQRNLDLNSSLKSSFGDSQKRTRSSSIKNNRTRKNDLIQLLDSGDYVPRGKGNGTKNNRHCSTNLNIRRYQPTPILTPLVSERNSNCPTTIRQMESLNIKQHQKYCPIKQNLNNNPQNVKPINEKQKGATILAITNIHQKLVSQLRRQIKSLKQVIDDSGNRFQKLAKTHRAQKEELSEQVDTINGKLKKEISRRKKLQEEVGRYQHKMAQSENIIKQQEKSIMKLQDANSNIVIQNGQLRQNAKQFASKIGSLEKSINESEAIKTRMEIKLKRTQQEKFFVKQQTQEVLKMLRQDFGFAFSKITMYPQQTKGCFLVQEQNC